MKNWKEKLRRFLTRTIILNSAMTAYEEADEKTKQKLLDVGTLAALNPDKVRQVKECLTGGGRQSVQKRLGELKQLHEQGLITGQEYETKKAQILGEI